VTGHVVILMQTIQFTPGIQMQISLPVTNTERAQRIVICPRQCVREGTNGDEGTEPGRVWLAWHQADAVDATSQQMDPTRKPGDGFVIWIGLP
jgi:hypothetical protein